MDVLDGSPPCQGFSLSGKRNIDDERNQMFREYTRLLRGLKPKAFVMENVSGMVYGKMKILFAEIMKELKDSGYNVIAKLMNTKYYAVPQSRQRIIFIGFRRDLKIAENFHPSPQYQPINLRKALVNLKDMKQIAPAFTPLKLARYHETMKGKAHKERFGFNRLNWNRPVPTILRVSGSGGHGHPDEPRLLSIGELQRCASFPDDFIFTGSWNDGVQGIGNSVPPLFMKSIAEHIKTILTNIMKAK